jgi:two-component system, OmpR family, response regulator
MADDDYRVMIVDDDPLQLSLVGRTLRSDGFRVVSSDSTLGVTNTVRSFQPHLILLDVRIPELPGDRLVPLLRRTSPDTLLILYSACDQDQLRRIATQVSADGWISKSEEIGKLGKKIKELIVKDIAAKARIPKPPAG